eukprot:TRINITY_DN646_c0_g1_i1.p1 TRINITY_DN646_c0_g1~~TRINITY_DN646_c0_g1_i1.p1  ORF type:complete len:203 (-),score=28.94 TRINITY_DN646_c0_g1_i1:22-630(-)
MEIEVKLRLPSREMYDKLLGILTKECGAPKLYEQENIFFDGTKDEFLSQKVALRLRFFEDEGKPRCEVTTKESGVVVNGISRAKETNEDISVEEARGIVHKSANLAVSTCTAIKTLHERFQPEGYKSLGGFSNTRYVFPWADHKLELDETKYEFGITWEIEIESIHPEEIKAHLESFLKAHDILYTESKKSKFVNFFTKKIK